MCLESAPSAITNFYTALSNNARRFHFPALDALEREKQQGDQRHSSPSHEVRITMPGALWYVI